MSQDLIVLAVLAAVPAGLVLYWYWRSHRMERRRRALRGRPPPAGLTQTLARNVRFYERLPAGLKTELHGHVNVFLDEKAFIGCDGLVVTDEMRFTVAGLACLLQLRREPGYFPGFSSVLLYPDAYVADEVTVDGELETHERSARAGESWHRGPVVLSWADVLRGAEDDADGYNVVLHEFAHKLDEENSNAHGLPVLNDQAHYDEWASVLAREYRSLERRVAQGESEVLDDYALTSPAEFFAVATESFYEKPAAMRDELPDLYEQLRRFYRVDPAAW